MLAPIESEKSRLIYIVIDCDSPVIRGREGQDRADYSASLTKSYFAQVERARSKPNTHLLGILWRMSAKNNLTGLFHLNSNV